MSSDPEIEIGYHLVPGQCLLDVVRDIETVFQIAGRFRQAHDV